MNLINEIHNKVFNTRIFRKPKASIYSDSSVELNDKIIEEYLHVQLVVMSYETHREIMRLDYSNSTGILDIIDKTQPYRILGKRIAFDESLKFGEVLVAGDVV
jgi:hypothetical protein